MPALDGIRAIAILLVIAGHTISWFDTGGPIGVSAFFTLSGFLITSLLLAERDHTGIRLGAFYLRRARRLLPAFVVVLVATVAVGQITLREAMPPLLYVENLARIANPASHPLSHTWSLSIEEQFYVAFPLSLLFLGRRLNDRALLGIFGALTIASAATRVLLNATGTDNARLYYGTDTNACLLLLGICLALGLRLTPWRPPTLATPITAAALIALGALPDSDTARTIAPLLASLLTAVLISATLDHEPEWLTNRTLTLVGRRSYALYLWHWPALYVWVNLGRGWVTLGVVLVVTWGITLLSWRYVEEPFLHRHVTPSARPVTV